MPAKTDEQFHSDFYKRDFTSHKVRTFRTIVYRFYSKNARYTLPWRNTDVPYHILVSEIMLQQTQIERVLLKYPLFIKKYPGFPSLARARMRSLYAVWRGMGYNRRALALRDIARTIVKPPYSGTLPSDAGELMSLPFVGQSTAGAVAAFAFNKPVVFIETNIRRVFIHFFFRGRERVTDSEIIPLIERTLDRRDPRNWYYALMDYGSALGKRKDNPNIKSAHYKKQSPFEGSDRQLRGTILRLVSKQRNISFKDLSGRVDASRGRMLNIIDQLCREGFLQKKGALVMISL